MPQLFRCPYRGLPTLSERSAYEICLICWWEDDGQDDATADEVWAPPNGEYSLTAARANFFAHGHMYNRGAGIAVVEQPGPTRVELLTYARAVLSGAEPLDEAKLQNLLEAYYEKRDG
jgi:hypothetical protein